MTPLFKSTYKNFFFLSLLVYLITAYFSDGYYHPDEHFQILEFCNYKLGNSSPADLPWEFHEKIRPALQPSLAWALVKTFSFVGISSPFTWAMLMRIITALFAWFIACKFCLLLIRNFSSDFGKRIFILIVLFSWFVPFITVRFSSENYSALTFLYAVYFLVQFSEGERSTNLGRLILAGLLLGFSFYFRFQIAFAILGFGLWLIFIRRIKIKYLSLVIVSAACSVGICMLIDNWFYGGFEITPINYFVSNIVDNKAAQWGVYPWWWYFHLFFQQAVPPFSIFLLLFFFIGIYKKPTDVFTWCMIPFILAHFWVGHKEMRFMFPMLLGFMYITAIGIDYVINLKKYEKVIRVAFVLSVIVNLPLLVVRMFIPAQEAIGYYRFLQEYSAKSKMELFSVEKNAYTLSGIPVNFYKSPNVSSRVVKNTEEFRDYINTASPTTAFILERNLTAENQFYGYQTNSIYCVYPLWIRNFNINDWQSRAEIWNIQRLDKIK